MITDKGILTIGVTGSAGSGKSLVCRAFKELGLLVLDCDQIARKVVEPGQKAYEEVVELFGPGVVRPDKTLDRPIMRNLMVDHPGLRKELEAVLHPIILSTLFHEIEMGDYRDEPACAAEVPLLFELGLENRFDRVITVTGDRSLLASRIASRDGVSRKSAGKMLDLQMDQDEKIRRSDHVIGNDGTPEALFDRVRNLYLQIKKEFLTSSL